MQLFGGVPEDYLKIRDWVDESKAHSADSVNRALGHHSEAIFLCEGNIRGDNHKQQREVGAWTRDRRAGR